MTKKQKNEITKISKDFFSGFEEMFDTINGTGWLIVDPLSAYLNLCGFKNTLTQYPESENHPQVMLITFWDGSVFIPAGGDLKYAHEKFKNWMWIDKHNAEEWLELSKK